MTKQLSKEAIKAEQLFPEINANHRECMKCGRDSIHHACEAGRLLLALKECVKHGEFESTVEKRCDFAIRTAQAYMKLANGLPALQKQGKQIGVDATIGGCLKLITESKKSEAPKAQAVRFSPKPGESKKTEPEPFVDPIESACEHDFDDEACRKCHAPKPVKQHNDKFAFGANEGNGESCDLAAKQAPYDEMLNAITAITKVWNTVTDDERDGVYAVEKKQRVEVQLRDLRGPIAQARPHALCDHCKGKGCKNCRGCGWWPRSVVEGLRK